MTGARRHRAELRRLARQALAAYDIDPVRLSLLGDDENTTIRVDADDGDRYVLRIHRDTGDPFHPVRTRAEIEAEMTWLAAIRTDLGDVAPRPVAAGDGSTVTVADDSAGGRFCVVLGWVEGRFHDAGLTPSRLAMVGRLMARLHDQATAFRPGTDFTRPQLERFPAVAAAFAADQLGWLGGPAAGALATAVLERVAAADAALGRSADHFGLIHGDLHQENYLFGRGRVVAIDFDDCGWGHFLSDLAVTISELEHLPAREALEAAFLRGYQGVRPLPAGLDELLPTFTALRRLKIVLWLAERLHRSGFAGWAQEAEQGLEAIEALLAEGERRG